MTSSSNPESTPADAPQPDDSPSVADRLETAGRAVWTAFLAAVVVFALLPVVGVLSGVAPFDAPDPMPYYALVGVALVGTAALVAAAMLDV